LTTSILPFLAGFSTAARTRLKPTRTGTMPCKTTPSQHLVTGDLTFFKPIQTMAAIPHNSNKPISQQSLLSSVSSATRTFPIIDTAPVPIVLLMSGHSNRGFKKLCSLQLKIIADQCRNSGEMGTPVYAVVRPAPTWLDPISCRNVLPTRGINMPSGHIARRIRFHSTSIVL
jgi:hypothetical protein